MDVDAGFRLPPGWTLLEQAGPRVTVRKSDGQVQEMQQLPDGSLVDFDTYRNAELDRVSGGASGVFTVRHAFAGVPLAGSEQALAEKRERWRLLGERAGRAETAGARDPPNTNNPLMKIVGTVDGRPVTLDEQIRAEKWHRRHPNEPKPAAMTAGNTNNPLMKIVGTVDGRPVTLDEQILAEKWHRRHPNEPKPAAMTAGDERFVGTVEGRPVTLGEFGAAVEDQRRNPGAPPPPELALAGSSFSVP